MKHVIVGNGIAGVSAAETIRMMDETANITIIGDETFPPYSRPMISYVLAGSQPHGKPPIRSNHFYDDLKITAVLGQRASSIDVVNRQVLFADGTCVDFDRLLIAAGADPRPLKAEGLHLQNIFYLRTQEHVQQLVAAVDCARRAIVLGGGLVGFKAAYGLLKRGLSVTMLITSGYPLSMQVDETAGNLILTELIRHGLRVEVGVTVCAFEGNGAVQAAVTDSGTRLPCDMVIVGKGVLPVRTFIPRAQIAVDLGVLVDEHLQTSTPGIYAAGDEVLNRGKVYIPVAPQEAVGGFSVETIIGALGGTPEPLIDAIKAGKIRGAVGIVGCNNPKIKHDYGHVTLTRRLIENDILVVDTGCVAIATAKAGFKVPAAADMAGPGLKEICKALGIPPVLHMGSCVDNVRILVLVSALADALGVDISDLPVAGSAPEWYSEKAVTIGTYFVASGVTTHLGPMPPITGSMNVVKLLTAGLNDVVGATFAVEPDPEKAAIFLRKTIEGKRKALGLDTRSV